MARPPHAPDFLPLFPGAVRDPLDALEDPDYSSDEEDAGELQVGRYFVVMRERGLDDEEASDEEDSDEEDSDEEASDEEASDEETSEEEDEADSGYGSLSEEDISEEEDEDTEGEEEDEDTEGEEEDEDTESEEEDEDTESEEEDQRPREARLLLLQRFFSRVFPASPPPAPCPVFEEERRPGGSRRHRDGDEEEEPISKRPRFSYSEDIEEEPTPSTSAGTSGGFVHYFQQPHLLQDSDSD